MIQETLFNTLNEKLNTYQNTSMHYLDYDECMHCDLIENNDQLILLHDLTLSPSMVYYATQDFHYVIQYLKQFDAAVRIHFVPKGYEDELLKLGFVEWGEFIDFFNDDIQEAQILIDCKACDDFLEIEECEKASQLSMKCKLQSRGFEGESAEWFKDWIQENKTLIHRINNEIVGYCCVAIYGESPTLWVREIAVDPAFQGMGIGNQLIQRAIHFGQLKGAGKGFLMADLLNENAINLYQKYGFHPKGSDSELQMIRL